MSDKQRQIIEDHHKLMSREQLAKELDILELLLKKTPKSYIFGRKGLPLYKFNGSGKDLCKLVEDLPTNANFIASDGMWTLEKK